MDGERNGQAGNLIFRSRRLGVGIRQLIEHGAIQRALLSEYVIREPTLVLARVDIIMHDVASGSD